MNLTVSQKGLILAAVPFLFQFAFVLAVVRLLNDHAEAERWAVHSKGVIARAHEAHTLLNDARAGVQGYVITADPKFADPYRHSHRELPGHLAGLLAAVQDSPGQTAQAGRVQATAAAMVDWLGGVEELVANGDRDAAAARVRSGVGYGLMEEFRREFATFLAEEERLDHDRQAALAQSRGRLNLLFVIGGVAAVAGTLILAFGFRRGIAGRFAALEGTAKGLAAGGPLPPPLGGDDEMARLDRAFRAMAAELTRSTGLVRDLYDHAPCGYHSVGPDGVIVSVNRTELGWLGYDEAEVVGRMRFADFVTPASRAAYLDGFARVQEHGSVAEVELELVRKDGTTFPVLVGSSSVRDADGRYLRSRTTLTDITERKRAEAAVTLFADVARSIPLGLVIYQLDGPGADATLHFRSANREATRLLGTPLDGAVGRPVMEVFPAIPPDEFRRYVGVAASGVADDLGELLYGDERVAARWWAVHAFPLPERSVGVAFRDVSDRRRAEDAVRLFATVAEAVPIGLLIFRLEGGEGGEVLRVRSGNRGAARLLGVSFDETAGRPVADVFPATRADRVRRYEAVAATGREDDLGEFPYAGDRWCTVLAFPLPDRSVGVAFQDVTARKRAEDEVRRLNAELEGRVRERTAALEDANRELAQKNAENEMFVYSVSHDLRSPLVNLQGFSKELEKACRGLGDLLAADGVPGDVTSRGRTILDGKAAKSLGFIQSAVLRLSNIIDALLRLSRAGRVEYRWEVVDVRGVVERVVASAQGTITDRGATVQVAPLPAAWGDRTAVEQLFGNLIGNALTYLDPARPGLIEVGTADAPAGTHAYFVRDNGLGIPEAHRLKIFQPFQRAHPGVGSGEGLGLAIVARVVERHRGRVWVESIPGVGSTFFVTLPAPPGEGGSDA